MPSSRLLAGPLAVAVVGAAVAVSSPALAALTGSTTPAAIAGSCPTSYTRAVDVTTADQLTAALANATAGDEIRMADGTYAGTFMSAAPGTAAAPVVICGSSAAVIDGGTTATGYALYVANAPYTSI